MSSTTTTTTTDGRMRIRHVNDGRCSKLVISITSGKRSDDDVPVVPYSSSNQEQGYYDSSDARSDELESGSITEGNRPNLRDGQQEVRDAVGPETGVVSVRSADSHLDDSGLSTKPRPGPYINVVKIESDSKMSQVVRISVDVGQKSFKDVTRSPSSSGIDTDPEKSDSECDSNSYSSFDTHSSNEDATNSMVAGVNFINITNLMEADSGGGDVCTTEMFHVREYEQFSDECDATKVAESEEDRESFIGHRDVHVDGTEPKIMSLRGTVRGVKNRVRAGIATFLQHQAELQKNYPKLEAGKVVVYTTTMGVVRKTFDRCRMVRNILLNLMIKYDERDAFMNRSIQTELMERLDLSRVIVPQVFVEGQLLGDAEQIEKLNECGELRKLLRPYKRTSAAKTCQKCGGYKYLPCNQCNGSKKSPQWNHFMEYASLKCMHCDEGGLIKCDACVDA